MSILIRLPKYDYELSFSKDQIRHDYPKSMLGQALTLDPSVTDLNIDVGSITPEILAYVSSMINDRQLPVPGEELREGLGQAGKYLLIDLLRVSADPLYPSFVQDTKINLLDLTPESYEKCMTRAISNKFLQLIDYVFRGVRRAPYKDIDPRLFLLSMVKGLPKVASAFLAVRKVDPSSATWTEDDHYTHAPYIQSPSTRVKYRPVPDDVSPAIYYAVNSEMPPEFIKVLVHYPGIKISEDLIWRSLWSNRHDVAVILVLAGGAISWGSAELVCARAEVFKYFLEGKKWLPEIDQNMHNILPYLPLELYMYILESPHSTQRMTDCVHLGLSVIEHKTSSTLGEVKDMNVIGMALLISIRHGNPALAKSLYAKYSENLSERTRHQAKQLCQECTNESFKKWSQGKFKTRWDIPHWFGHT